MSIETLAECLKNKINNANPNTIADQLRAIGLGSVLRALPTQLTGKNPATNSYNLATVQCITLPEDAKAAFVIAAYARAGTGAGNLIVDAPSLSPGVAPASGHIQVTPNGDIGLLAADGLTGVDVIYQPLKYDVVELTLPCAASVATLPTKYAGNFCLNLIEAEALAGAVVGKKIVLTPGAGGPATLQARLNLAKTTVTFNNGTDAVTSARVKLAVVPSIDISALLGALTNIA